MILMPGTQIEFCGEQVTVGAVGLTGGERYYWLTHPNGTVSMMPADAVEPVPYAITDKGRDMLKGCE